MLHHCHTTDVALPKNVEYSSFSTIAPLVQLLLVKISFQYFSIFKGDVAAKTKKSSWHVIQDPKTGSAEYSESRY
jgi:hypothetical protein